SFSGKFGKKAAKDLVAAAGGEGALGMALGGKVALGRWGILGRLAGGAFGVAFVAAAAAQYRDELNDLLDTGREWLGSPRGPGERHGGATDQLPFPLPLLGFGGGGGPSPRERSEMNERLRTHPGVTRGPRTPWDGPLRAPSPGRRPRARGGSRRRVAVAPLTLPENVIRIEDNRPITLQVDRRILAETVSREVSDVRARR
ncbi:MAG TPA: hypothetical protein VNT32_15580, partial [Thermoleophilaceae bacterium]|nr:hypothetical protein [Thermoleophilaceae bacterium]